MGKRRGITRDIGATGLDQAGWGYIQDDFLKEWNGAEKVKNIDKMLRNSPAVGALRLAIEMNIRNVDWFISGEDEDDPRVEFVNQSLENMSKRQTLKQYINDAILAVFYGWQKSAIIYERVNGALMWKRFKMLGHDTVQRWLIDEASEIQGVQQWPHLYSEPIPIDRMVLQRFRTTKNNPEGESVLRPAWPAFYYATNLQQIEAIGLERGSVGFPMITPPMGADMSDGSADRTAAEKIVRNARLDEQAGIVLPPPTGEGDNMRWHFELLGSPNVHISDFGNVISRYEKRILMSSLAQFIFLGMDNVGALATSESGKDFFTAVVQSVADEIAEVFTTDAIDRLLRLNGYDPRGVRLDHSPAGDVDIESILKAVQAGGIILTPKDEIQIRSILGMPEFTTEEMQEVWDEKQAANDARAAAFLQKRGDDSPDNEDDMSVDWFAAPIVPDNHPNDDAVQRMERKWYRTGKKYFDGQFERTMKAAKSEKSNRL